MKKILLATLCATGILVGANFAKAQEVENLPPPPAGDMGELPPPPHFGHGPRGHGPSPEMREKMEKKMAEELGLTEEQQAKAKEIREEGRKKVEPLMLQMKELREKMDEMRKENMAEFEAILTPEQKTKLEKIKAEHIEKMKEKHKGKHKGMFKHKHKKHNEDKKSEK